MDGHADAQGEGSQPGLLTWAVGSVSQRLGIAQGTLRTWERRYQLGPSQRTDGGHRRYTASDIERVDFMRRLLDRGVTPREAAKAAHDLDADEVAALLFGEQLGDAELTTVQTVDAILDAVIDIDPSRLSSLFSGVLRRHGVVKAWDTVLTPALIRVGEAWSDGTIGVVSEHIASERLLAELRLHSRSLSAPLSHGGIVLASAEEEQHALPVFALEAALAERGTGSFVLGGRVPWGSLADLARRTEPDVIFVWATLERHGDDTLLDAVATLPAGTRLVLGGPGWGELVVPGATRANDMSEAIDLLIGTRRGGAP